MKTIITILFGLFSTFPNHCHAAEQQWIQWPIGAKEIEPSIRIPATFKAIPPSVRASDRTIISGRFQSPDGAVEFAITAVYVRHLDSSIKARAIELPILPGESVKDRKSTKRRIKSTDGDYFIYGEDVTVEGPKRSYVRYFRIELSTGTLPGAASCLWEFKVADKSAQKAYQATYSQFKKTLNLGED